LPAALFVNHIKNTKGIEEELLEVDQNFASSCSDIIQQNNKFSGYPMSGPYHVNVLSSQNVKDSFLNFLQDILKDIETNRR
jgi:hypothetical protein